MTTYVRHFISGEEDLNDVTITCSSLAAQWQQLCTFLGLSFKTISTIKENNSDDSAASWNDALKQWILIQKHSFPSWKTLLTAVSRVDQPLFEKLAKEHQLKGTYKFS